MRGKGLRKAALCIALGACMGALAPAAFAQDGSVVGRVIAPKGESFNGLSITVRNPDTGFSRAVAVDANGNYRIPLLPVGNYVMELSRDGGAATKVTDVTVSIGNATTVNVPISGISTLGSVQVSAPRVINMVDVTSTESAMNISSQDVARLPVAQDLKSVALLAPGVVAGKSSLGSQGISFGGSSVAENSVYIDGLNVTDFYNRVGFSAAPFLFFQDFQVKTGGYSVEFGRTTGGVINASTKSGSNEFHAGMEMTFEPSALQAKADDHYAPNGDPYIISSKDGHDTNKIDLWASGALIKDKLFFFGLYEGRFDRDRYTNSSGTTYSDGSTNDGSGAASSTGRSTTTIV
jgi:hypothetical protein